MSERERKLVVIADDDPDILDLVAFRLEEAGFEVLKASDGQEALDLTIEHIPDLCVLDAMMPRMDGYELTRRLRDDGSTDSIPIILLTARVQEADIERGFEAGATDYVRKPFSPEELRARVRAALARS
jgi:DNA-binding response OmpR family regulator